MIHRIGQTHRRKYLECFWCGICKRIAYSTVRSPTGYCADGTQYQRHGITRRKRKGDMIMRTCQLSFATACLIVVQLFHAGAVPAADRSIAEGPPAALQFRERSDCLFVLIPSNSSDGNSVAFARNLHLVVDSSQRIRDVSGFLLGPITLRDPHCTVLISACGDVRVSETGRGLNDYSDIATIECFVPREGAHIPLGAVVSRREMERVGRFGFPGRETGIPRLAPVVFRAAVDANLGEFPVKARSAACDIRWGSSGGSSGDT